MKLISFNANSIRKRLSCGQMQDLIAAHSPDLIGVQETKVDDSQFPFAALEELGYSSAVFGTKARHGVALLSKLPMANVVNGLPEAPEDSFVRIISADLQLGHGRKIRVINGYFPQGERRDHESKFPHKRRFYQALQAHLEALRTQGVELVLMGDMNVARSQQDIGLRPADHQRWLERGVCCVLPEEQQWLEQILNLDLLDSYRLLHPEGSEYSWFDYRTRAFEGSSKRGLRIDYILISFSLQPALRAAGIDYDLRAHPNASDHAPIWVELQAET